MQITRMKQLLLTIALSLACAHAGYAYTTETINIPSERLPKAMDVTVLTPDAAKEDPAKKFPTVYILNGYDGNNTSWTTLTDPNLGKYADQYGMVFVMPDGMDSWYWDSPERPDMQMESFITKELVPLIDSKYPTINNASQRAITGLSMGGHGALRLGMLHTDLFGSAGSMSGGVDIRPFPNSWKMKQWIGERDENPARWDSMTVMTLVPTLKDKNLNIIFDCGVDDFFAGVNEQLHQAMVEAKIPHDYSSRPGKHSHQYWRNSIAYHLLYFDKAFRQAKESEK